MHLKSINELNTVISTNKMTMILYFTTSCSVCHSLTHKIKSYINENNGVFFADVRVDDTPIISSQKGIFSAPTVELYVNGKLTIKKSGHFSLEEIFEKINYYKKILHD